MKKVYDYPKALLGGLTLKMKGWEGAGILQLEAGMLELGVGSVSCQHH